MKQRHITVFLRSVFRRLRRKGGAATDAVVGAVPAWQPAAADVSWAVVKGIKTLAVVGAVGGAGWLVVQHPPVEQVQPGYLGVRTNLLTGTSSQWREGSVWVFPGLHGMRQYSLRDQTYRPESMQSAQGSAALQSIEGLSLGVDFTVRYAVDPRALATRAGAISQQLEADVVEPALQGLVYKIFARHTVREIFSTHRADIQKRIEADLRERLASEGVILKSIQIGKIDLPAEYRQGLDALLAEELATEKMRYTLELKEKRVQETSLEAAAEKARREVEAEAAAREQIIAARAQEEAMKHVLPFKQRQIEQRQLEAEAERVSRVKAAQGNAEARRIEAQGEADARQKLAEAEVARLEKIGLVQAQQMAREGELISRHPLLIQKAMADKLSDKIQVIIAPPSTSGGFIGNALLGQGGAHASNTANNTAVE